MLKPKRKIAKRELKQDALVSTYARFTTFYLKRKKIISTGATVLIVLVLAVVIYVKNQRSNNESAATDIAKVMPYFDRGEYASAIDGVPEQQVPGLRSIVHNYGGTESGEQARFYLGAALFQLGRYDEALEEYEDVGASDRFFRISRLQGIAACYEAKQEYKEAASNYEEAASAGGDDLRTPENLDGAARNYILAGEKEKALELYKKLKKNYPATTYGREADRYIAELSV